MESIYYAVQIGDYIGVFNDSDELGGLIDRDIKHTILGRVCDDREYGDRCTTDCPAYARGVCRAINVRDSDGHLWHVLP